MFGKRIPVIGESRYLAVLGSSLFWETGIQDKMFHADVRPPFPVINISDGPSIRSANTDAGDQRRQSQQLIPNGSCSFA